jgi:hypothetical protein
VGFSDNNGGVFLGGIFTKLAAFLVVVVVIVAFFRRKTPIIMAQNGVFY